jgi:hypothetical protein
MILNGIKYLFYSIYKITSINYGKEGGAYASYIVVSILLSINFVSLIGFICKLCFDKYNISLITLMLVFVISLFFNYMSIIYKLKYKDVISYFEERKESRVLGVLKVLAYVFISFGFLALVILIN